MKSNIGFQGSALRGKHCYLFISSIRRWISASLSSSASAISEMVFPDRIRIYSHFSPPFDSSPENSSGFLPGYIQ